MRNKIGYTAASLSAVLLLSSTALAVDVSSSVQIDQTGVQTDPTLNSKVDVKIKIPPVKQEIMKGAKEEMKAYNAAAEAEIKALNIELEAKMKALRDEYKVKMDAIIAKYKANRTEVKTDAKIEIKDQRIDMKSSVKSQAPASGSQNQNQGGRLNQNNQLRPNFFQRLFGAKPKAPSPDQTGSVETSVETSVTNQ